MLAFTLAEVLITLVIIGVIAAITVPSLMNKTNNQETVSKLKKAYSVLQNSIHKISLEKGYSQGDYSFVRNGNSFMNDFSKTVAYAKECSDNSSCFGTDYHRLNGSNLGITGSTNAIVTNDGIVYTFSNNVSADYFDILETDIPNYIGRFSVDVNGRKKPNKAGIDIFFFVLINGKGVLPAGYNTAFSDCNKNSSGFTCAAKILKEDAINY